MRPFRDHCYCRDPEAKLAQEETAKHAVKAALRSASSHHRVPKGAVAGGSPAADGVQNGSDDTGGALESPAAEEADLLEAGRLAGGGGADAGFVSSQHASGAQQQPPRVATAAAEDVSLRSTSSSRAATAAPRCVHGCHNRS
jgi:hypothetical protein